MQYTYIIKQRQNNVTMSHAYRQKKANFLDIKRKVLLRAALVVAGGNKLDLLLSFRRRMHYVSLLL